MNCFFEHRLIYRGGRGGSSGARSSAAARGLSGAAPVVGGGGGSSAPPPPPNTPPPRATAAPAPKPIAPAQTSEGQSLQAESSPAPAPSTATHVITPVGGGEPVGHMTIPAQSGAASRGLSGAAPVVAPSEKPTTGQAPSTPETPNPTQNAPANVSGVPTGQTPPAPTAQTPGGLELQKNAQDRRDQRIDQLKAQNPDYIPPDGTNPGTSPTGQPLATGQNAPPTSTTPEGQLLRDYAERKREERLANASAENPPPMGQMATADTSDTNTHPGFDFSHPAFDTSGMMNDLQTMFDKITNDPKTLSAFSSAVSTLQNDLANLEKQKADTLSQVSVGEQEQKNLFATQEERAAGMKSLADQMAETIAQQKIKVLDTNKAILETEQRAFQVKQTIQEHQQVRDNLNNEMAMRRAANRLGIAEDTNGLRWMSDAVSRGVDQLNELVSNGQMISQKYALTINEGYKNDVTQTLNEWQQQQNTNLGNYFSQIAEINKLRTADAQERRTERLSVEKDYRDQQTALDSKTAELMSSHVDKMIDRQIDMNKFLRDQSWKQLEFQRSSQEFGITANAAEREASTKMAQSLRDDLLKDGQPVKMYSETKVFANAFNDAFYLYASPGASSGDRAAAAAQMANQFTHMQNVGSIRVSELTAVMAAANQSEPEKFFAFLAQAVQGGSELSEKTMIAMKELSDRKVEDWKQQSKVALSHAIAQASRYNADMRSSDHMITAGDLTTDPDLLSSAYQSANSAASMTADQMGWGGSSDTTTSNTSMSPQQNQPSQPVPSQHSQHTVKAAPGGSSSSQSGSSGIPNKTFGSQGDGTIPNQSLGNQNNVFTPQPSQQSSRTQQSSSAAARGLSSKSPVIAPSSTAGSHSGAHPSSGSSSSRPSKSKTRSK